MKRAARQRSTRKKKCRREREVRAAAFSRVAEAGSERSRVKAVKGREKEERAGESHGREERQHRRER